MEFYLSNKRKYRHVLIEKINHHSKEMSLYDILKEDYGFKEHIIERPLTMFEELKLAVNFKIDGNRTSIYNDWLTAEIEGSHYEVIFDIWSVELSKNGTKIFDRTRFENEELLKLIE